MRTVLSLIVLLSLFIAPFTARAAFSMNAKSSPAHEFVLLSDCCDQSKDDEKPVSADCSMHCSMCTPATFADQKIGVLFFKQSIKIRFVEDLSPAIDALKGVFEPPKHA